MKLQGKTALIAGGGGGIGRAVALALAHEGAKTAVADIVKDNAEKVTVEVKALGVDAIACQVDLTKKADVDRSVNEVLARFGHIDILVNCQGWDRLEPFVESQEETWEKLLAINWRRQDRQYQLRRRPRRLQLGSGVCRRQGSCHRIFKDHRSRGGAV
jgi:2-hydroxycyclohexanecarboxyl-CoA dehydrogenase